MKSGTRGVSGDLSKIDLSVSTAGLPAPADAPRHS